MIKDKDLYRALLIELEKLEIPHWQQAISPRQFDALCAQYGESVVSMHLLMLSDEGQLISLGFSSTGDLYYERLSPKARDFLDAFRDDNNWYEAKRLSQKAGGWTVELLLDIGKSILKKKIEDATGGLKLPI